MSDDEDVWLRQLRQVGGLRLVGARQELVCFMGKDMSVEWLRLVGARPMLRKNVGVEVEVD